MGFGSSVMYLFLCIIMCIGLLEHCIKVETFERKCVAYAYAGERLDGCERYVNKDLWEKAK